MLKLKHTDILKRSTRLAADAPVSVLDTAPGETNEAPDITVFLDAIIRRLSSLPSDTRVEIRRELRTHLDALIAAHEELGVTRDEAVVAAIRQLGEPSVIARRFRKAWQLTAAYQCPLAAMRIGLAGFGAASAVLLPVVAFGMHFGSGHSYIAPSVIVAFLVLFWSLPILAGIWVATRTRTRATLGSFLALSALTCVFGLIALICGDGSGAIAQGTKSGGVVGWAIAAACEGGYFAFLCWLPIGCLSAALTALVRTRRRFDRALV